MIRAHAARVAVTLVLLAAPMSGAASAGAQSDASGVNRAVVVIKYPNGVITRKVVTFATPTITGLNALQRAVSAVRTATYSSQGEAVCRINGFGNVPAVGSCLGEQDPSGRYWAYFRSPPDGRRFNASGTGASRTVVRNHSVEGWRFGTGQAPTFSRFCSVVKCG